MLEAITPLRHGKGKYIWLVRCDCGVEKEMPGTELTKGRIRSCGCSKGRFLSENRGTHRMSKHPAYAVWRSMCDRCRLPTHQAYANYGGRGITVCPEWAESFENFWSDMAEGYSKGLSLDRIDNNEGYSKSNCRWVNMKVQGRNKRNNVQVNTPEGRMTLSEASEKYGINVTTLCYRIAHGWPDSELFRPPDFRNRLEGV